MNSNLLSKIIHYVLDEEIRRIAIFYQFPCPRYQFSRMCIQSSSIVERNLQKCFPCHNIYTDSLLSTILY